MNNDLIDRIALLRKWDEKFFAMGADRLGPNGDEIMWYLNSLLDEIKNAPAVEPFAEVATHIRDRIEDINHEIMIPQSDEAKCILDGKRKGFQYVLDLLEMKKNETM